MVSEHAWPRAAKSAERIDGAMMAGGDIMVVREGASAGFNGKRSYGQEVNNKKKKQQGDGTWC